MLRDIDVISNITLITSLNRPICISVSRKSFMGLLLDLNVDERLIPSIVTEIYCISNGASLIRTHNVKETKIAMNTIKLLN